MDFWQIFVVFSLLAALFVLWPFCRRLSYYKAAVLGGHQQELQQTLLVDRTAELDAMLARGEVGADEYRSLLRDLHRDIEGQTAGEIVAPVTSSASRNRLVLIAVAMIVPVCTWLLYTQLGAKEDWSIAELGSEVYAAEGSTIEQQKELVQRLQERLQDTPENSQMWFMLGSAASSVGEYELAVRAYRTLLELHPKSPMVLAELAQALFMRAGNTVTPEVRQYTQQALSLEANLPTALGLAGIDAFQSGEYQQAIDMWQRAVQQLDPSSSGAQVLTRGIVRAQAALGSTAQVASQKADSSAVKPELKVSVSLAENVQGLQGGEAVFVYARAWQGPKMPLAIQRLTVSDLPIDINLNSQMAMAQGMDIHSVSQLEVVARISLTGSAAPQSGDWMASFGPIILSQDGKRIALEISEQLP